MPSNPSNSYEIFDRGPRRSGWICFNSFWLHLIWAELLTVPAITHISRIMLTYRHHICASIGVRLSSILTTDCSSTSTSTATASWCNCSNGWSTNQPSNQAERCFLVLSKPIDIQPTDQTNGGINWLIGANFAMQSSMRSISEERDQVQLHRAAEDSRVKIEIEIENRLCE